MYRLVSANLRKARGFRPPKQVGGMNFVPRSRFHTNLVRVLDGSFEKFLRYGLAGAVLGGFAYFGYSNDLLPNLSRIPLEEIDEDSFDSRDDLVVVILNSRKSYPREHVDRLLAVLPENVKLYYTVKKSSEGVRLMFCKGMRKKNYSSVDLGDESFFKGVVEDLQLFFQPQSQEVYFLNRNDVPEFVSYNNFQSTVVEASKENPIVVQLFEDGCFLCFLIRPFINSVNKHLVATNHPLRIKRLNIELNDFPKGCPVTRATPTFVYYDGGNGVKWNEFKPAEFIEKLIQVGNLGEASRAYLNELGESISQRFMLFGKLAHWLAESQKLQELIVKKYSPEYELTSDEDMKRSDCLEENLENLKGEIESAEKDCLAIAEILAEEVIESESHP